ncbi:unnamed protein product [Boreogadus saida]
MWNLKQRFLSSSPRSTRSPHFLDLLHTQDIQTAAGLPYLPLPGKSSKQRYLRVPQQPSTAPLQQRSTPALKNNSLDQTGLSQTRPPKPLAGSTLPKGRSSGVEEEEAVLHCDPVDVLCKTGLMIAIMTLMNID